MDKKSPQTADALAVEAVEELVRSLLDKGVLTSNISFALAFVATDLALQTAPSAEHAIAVVADAIRVTALRHADANADIDPDDDERITDDDFVVIDPEVFGRTIH